MLSDIPKSIRDSLNESLVAELNNFTFAGGGCISQGGKLETTAGNYFLKWNDALQFPGMFAAEARGLNLLRNPSVIRVPEVRLTDIADQWQVIAMEFIGPSAPATDYWQILGEQLASLHKNTANSFGLDHSNYIGSLPQHNNPSKNWIDFFVEQRLTPQLKPALNNKKIDAGIIKQFETLFKKLPSLLPIETPSLLHGDLWRGNLITDEGGRPCLIDPAVYYGHREMEIAFTGLFGGFSPVFYDSYQEIFPVSPGFKARSDVYNLYPLLVHVNLFGGGYLSQVVSILRQFV